MQLMTLLFLNGLLKLSIIDVIDIILFGFLLYEIYNLVKGTAAIRIFIGIIAVYLIWRIVRALQMELLSEILGQFISVGFIALIVVFQPEIRQFLLMVGNTRIIKTSRKRFLFWKFRIENPINLHIDTIVKACKKMADTKTGALIVIARLNELENYIATGQDVDARISEFMLETIFFKNSPLHDGAVIISGGTIRAARCILPLSSDSSIPAHCGLRHRAAVGISEKSDAIAIIVSEERGVISYAVEGKLTIDTTPSELSRMLESLEHEPPVIKKKQI
jgi:diadenylate cyclase